jgi:DNA excision repair protein ERCC-2
MADHAQPGTHPVISVRRTEGGGGLTGRAELYTCLPNQVTTGLFDDLAASVLMSATLRPFDVTEAVLGLSDPATLAYGQQFPPERRRTFAVDGPALFATRRGDDPAEKVVSATLRDIVEYTPGNTLLFFPSYAEAKRYHGQVEVDAATFLDEPDTPADDLRREFVASDRGVLYTSLWGTLSEGVSFDGDDARTAVVIGVPYPHLDDRMDAVQDAYAATFGANSDHEDPGWAYAIEAPTIRKTRQALGRVLRGPEEVGARILLDRRYCSGAGEQLGRYSVHDTFPPAVREELVDVEPDRLRYALSNFFRSFDAYPGPAPNP